MYSFSYLEPVCCPMSSSICCFLTFIQVSQEAGQVVWYSHLLQSFPHFIVIHTVKGFGVVIKAEIDVFLELSCFFDDLADIGSLISGSSAFSKASLNTWKFTVHVLLKPGLENFEHYFTSVWDECNCAVVWAFFGIAFLRDWNENRPFPVLWPLLVVKANNPLARIWQEVYWMVCWVWMIEHKGQVSLASVESSFFHSHRVQTFPSSKLRFFLLLSVRFTGDFSYRRSLKLVVSVF